MQVDQFGEGAAVACVRCGASVIVPRNRRPVREKFDGHESQHLPLQFAVKLLFRDECGPRFQSTIPERICKYPNRLGVESIQSMGLPGECAKSTFSTRCNSSPVRSRNVCDDLGHRPGTNDRFFLVAVAFDFNNGVR